MAGIFFGGKMDFLVGIFESNIFRNISFCFGVIVAIISVLTVRATARKKQSADVIFASRNDDLLKKGVKLIREEALNNDSNIRKYARAPASKSEEAAAIRYVLNHFEYVSVGIQGGIYDEDMFKNSSFSTIMEIKKHTETYISDVRADLRRDTVYQEFCWLCKRWEKSPLKVKKI